jgi:hypothetical protein
MMEEGVVTKIAELAKGQTAKIRLGPDDVLVHNGVVLASQPVEHPLPHALAVHTLTGLRDYLAENRDGLDLGTLAVHVVSPMLVAVLGRTYADTQQRPVHLRAECYDRFAAVPGFKFGAYGSHESMVIALHALFEASPDRDALLSLLSNVEQGNVRTDEDDGISQKVSVRSGISLVAERRIPNPVLLRPYRTFTEVAQPESRFVFRMRQGDAQQAAVALFEADGGAWRDEATALIRDWLAPELGASKVAVLV